MGSFGKYRYPAAMRLAVCLVLCGMAVSGRASPVPPAKNAETAAPPPVPLYSAGVTNTTVFGPGMIVIDTKDSFDTVLAWYRVNLKDQAADVAIDPQHHHYVTHDGASVDVSAEKAGAGTKIALFWKSATGIASQPVPTPDRAENAQPLAELAGVEPIPLLAGQPLATARPEPVSLKLMKPEAVEPLGNGPQAAAYLRDGRYGEALLAWEDEAAKGSAAAALTVGMMYDAGLGVPQSYPDAFNWYEMAAERGNPVAMFNIGVLDDAGLGLRRNPDEAAGWYEKAAAKGVGRAAFTLALLYEGGDGVTQDSQTAERYFRQAERQGVTAARNHLPGRHVHQADLQDDDLPFNTIHTVADGRSNGRSADTARLLSRADQGDLVAVYDLAYRLEKGIGSEADPRGAYMMYRRVADDTGDERLRRAAAAAATQLKAAGTAAVYAR